MKPDDQSFSAFVQVLRKRARPASMAALAVLLGMTIFVFSMPAVYESRATLLIDQPEVAPETLGGAGSREYVEQRLQRTRQLVLTAENIQTIMERHKLYSNDSGLTVEDKLAKFNGSVVITPQVTGVVDPRSMRDAELTYAFDVAFRHDYPEVARDIVSELVDLFITSSAVRAKADAERSIGFLRSEADRLEADLRSRETRLAEFRQEHYGGLPEQREGNLQRARDLERDLARVDDDLRAARARKELLEAQLSTTPRDSPVLNETGQVVIRGVDRLAAAQQELVAALAKYSEDHPDVRRLRREIASLSKEVAGGSAAEPTNPVFAQLQTQVNAANLAVRELAARRYEVSSSLNQVQAAIYKSPEDEREYADLVRDYELVKARYEQTRQRQATVELTQKATTADAGETYVLINPARVPENPIEPDRVALMFLAFVLAIAAGLGTASMMNAMDPTIRGSFDVASISGSPPLGSIPIIQTTSETGRRRLADIGLAIALIAAAAVALYVLA